MSGQRRNPAEADALMDPRVREIRNILRASYDAQLDAMRRALKSTEAPRGAADVGKPLARGSDS